jgi:hypothetical protein
MYIVISAENSMDVLGLGRGREDFNYHYSFVENDSMTRLATKGPVV